MFKNVVLALLTLSTWAYARMVVISDIDDTIKISHVLDKSESVKNAFRTENVFRGMPDLYQSIRSVSDADFYYISNAPKALMERSHKQFLADNKFPDGILLVREDLGDHNHKVNSIRTILNDPTVEAVIFIGDNGERDTLVYSQMSKEFSKIPSLTFIRQAYSIKNPEDQGRPLEPAQTGFVTPIEISIDLKNKGLLSEAQVVELEKRYIPITVSNAQTEDRSKLGELSFPSWIDCRDFQISMDLRTRPTNLANELVSRIHERCTRPAPED